MVTYLAKLSDGDEGTDETVAYMARLARRDSQDPYTLRLVSKLKLDSLPIQEAIQKAFDWIVDNVPYVKDPGRNVCNGSKCFKVDIDQELVIAPVHFLSGRLVGGDCDCMSTLLVSILLSIGVRCWFKVLAWRRWEYTHVYVLCEMPGVGIVPLDPVAGYKGFGWERPTEIRSKMYAA